MSLVLDVPSQIVIPTPSVMSVLLVYLSIGFGVSMAVLLMDDDLRSVRGGVFVTTVLFTFFWPFFVAELRDDVEAEKV